MITAPKQPVRMHRGVHRIYCCQEDVLRSSRSIERRICLIQRGGLSLWVAFPDGSNLHTAVRREGECFVLGEMRQPASCQRLAKVRSEQAEILVIPRHLLRNVCGDELAKDLLADLRVLTHCERALVRDSATEQGRVDTSERALLQSCHHSPLTEMERRQGD